VADACRDLNRNSRAIRYALAGNQKTCAGYEWWYVVGGRRMKKDEALAEMNI